jgi:hypothetical protein
MTTVIINDFINDRRTTIVLHQDYFDKIETIWHKEDRILLEMQDNDFFAGRTKWSDLSPSHFRLMITRNMTVASELPDDERNDSRHPVVRSMHMLMTALIYCIQENTESLVDLLRIIRHSETQITYDFSASLNVIVDISKPNSDLRIVVDNDIN